MKHADVIIVGAGAAGLFTAINLAPYKKVLVLSGPPLGGESSSYKAQGGIAAAVGKNDSAFSHTKDTLKAGAGISDPHITDTITQAAPDYIQILRDMGVGFDISRRGNYHLSREACHTTRRVLRAKTGDGFGKELMRALVHEVTQHKNITVVENVSAERLLKTQGRVYGVAARHTVTNTPIIYKANTIVLATGGIGGLYAQTTNPLSSIGRGVVMAARAGAVISDLEFVQFHPTALDIGEDPAPLATEALRGEGAILVNENGERFMKSYHKAHELAPRDIVSRGIFAQIQKGKKVYLDCRNTKLENFTALKSACARAHLNPEKDLIPVTPAVHYHMGGVATDIDGKTSIQGLWACGEVAATGLHGANRLASNSLIEAIVMGGRVAENIVSNHWETQDVIVANVPEVPQTECMIEEREHLRQVMSKFLGVIRDQDHMLDGLRIITNIEERSKEKDSTLEDMALLARMITVSALQRKESRGGHCRSDYPDTEPLWQKRSFTTLNSINDYVRKTRKAMEYIA